MDENKIENYLCRKVKENGGIAEKLIYASKRGSADRWCFFPNGRLYMVEVKQPLGRLSQAQKIEQARMELLGFDYRVVWSKDEVDAFIKEVVSCEKS